LIYALFLSFFNFVSKLNASCIVSNSSRNINCQGPLPLVDLFKPALFKLIPVYDVGLLNFT